MNTINHIMSYNTMSDLTNETLKTYILADRKTLLDKVVKDMSSVSQKNAPEYLSTFKNSVQTYMDLAIPEVATKKRKIKVDRFRKISPYFAYCTNFRNSKRDKSGKLTSNVLDITKEAGANWRKMSEKDRKPWVDAAEKLTTEAKVAWDLKHASSNVVTPSPDAIRDMKKADVVSSLRSAGVSIPAKANLNELREMLVAHFATADSVVRSLEVKPTADQIVKMKKAELLDLVERAGLSAKKETKAMQQALISHFAV